MEQILEKAPPPEPPEKPPLFQQWMQANPALHPYIVPKEWFVFLQFIVKTLKVYDGEEVDIFIEAQIPRLFKKDVPFAKVSDAFTYLRFLLLKHILDDPHATRENKDHGTIRLISLFDNIFRLVRERFPTETDGEQEAAIFGDSDSPLKAGITLLKFQVEENRLDGKSHLDTALAQWLGVGIAQASSFSKWKSCIHPEDLDQFQSMLRKAIQRRQPIYEASYRLRHHNDEWREMYELGKINYDDKGDTADFTAVVIVQSDFNDDQTIENILPQISDYILDAKKDLALIIDKNARLVHVTKTLLKFLINDRGPLFNPETWVNLGEPFFELLDDENKIIAKNFWGAISADHTLSRKLLLKLSNDRKGKEKIIEFSPFILNQNVHAPHFIIWGQVVPRRRSADVFNERLSILSGLGEELVRLSDLNSFYKKVLESIQRLIPRAQSAAIIVKSMKGFEYGIGFGYENERLYNKLILNPEISSRLEVGIRAGQYSETGFVDDPEIKVIIRDTIAGQSETNAGANGALEEDNRQVVGVIQGGNIPYALLEINTFGSKEPFSEIDLQSIKLALQLTSAALSNHFLSNQLQESAFNYSNIFDKSPLAIYLMQDDVVKLTNRKLLKMLGIDSVLDGGFEIWQYIHVNDINALRNQLKRLNGQVTSLEAEFRLKNQNGDNIYCTGFFQRIQYNNRPAIMCEILDTSRIHKLEKQLLKSQKMDTIGAMAADVAHDFNNILAAIIPSAQLILRNPQKIPENNQRAKTIFNMAQRAAELTRKMQSYSNADAKAPEIFNLNGLISDTAGMLDQMVGPAIKINYSLKEQLPAIRGTYEQLVQMLINLVVNGRDAMPGGGSIHISTDEQQIERKNGKPSGIAPGTYVRLTVKDAGSGIPPENRQKIFKPFFTTRDAEKHAGLGLSVVYGILKKHNGYVMLQSEENKGATFKMYLPATTETANQPQPKAPFLNKQASPNEKKTILVVDDEKHLRDVFSGMIRFFGYELLEAGSGQDAVQLYQKRNKEIDLVIIDYAMPGMSGKETYEAVKRLNPAVEVILCTGYGEKEEVATLVKDEHLHFLPKPFTIETLEDKIKVALNEK